MENYEIYMQVFDGPQAADTSVEEFLSPKLKLLQKINPRNSEETELDMLYGFLNQKIRDKIPRKSVATFKELLGRSKEVEKTLASDRKKSKESAHETAKAVKVLNVSSSNSVLKHLRPGVIFEVEGRREVGFLNTSSNVNIASHVLFSHLKKCKYVFRTSAASVNDFVSAVTKTVHITNAKIALEDHTFNLQFVYFDDVKYKVSVLGYEFITKANIWMHLSSEDKWVWGFANTPKDEGLASIDVDQVLEGGRPSTVDYLSVSFIDLDSTSHF